MQEFVFYAKIIYFQEYSHCDHILLLLGAAEWNRYIRQFCRRYFTFQAKQGTLSLKVLCFEISWKKHFALQNMLDPVYSAGAGRARAECGLNWGTRYPNFVRLQWRARPGLNFNLSIFCPSGALHVNKQLFGGTPFERLL